MAEPAVTAAPLKKRKPGGPPLPPGWKRTYLANVRKLGLYHLAAEATGVHPRTVERYRARHPKFDALCESARFTKREQLEHDLVEVSGYREGNPVGFIARLKAMGAHEYIDRQFTASVSVVANTPQAIAAAHSVIAQLLASSPTAPTTAQAMLSAPPTTPGDSDAGQETGSAPITHTRRQGSAVDSSQPADTHAVEAHAHHGRT